MKIKHEVIVGKQEMEDAIKQPMSIESLLNDILREFNANIYVMCDVKNMNIIFKEKEKE